MEVLSTGPEVQSGFVGGGSGSRIRPRLVPVSKTVDCHVGSVFVTHL